MASLLAARRGGLLGRLGRWLGGGGSVEPERVAERPVAHTAAERLDAARDRLKDTIEAPEDEAAADQ